MNDRLDPSRSRRPIAQQSIDRLEFVTYVDMLSQMGREIRTSRREQRRERKEQEQAAAFAAERAAKRKRIVLVLVPVVTVALALGFYQIGLSHFIVGMVLLAGFFCWLGIGLSAIGASVQARNRRGAGSINFGKRG